MNAVAKELNRLAKSSGGLLQPEMVVEAARPESSPLHSRFEWDDTKAGHEYRIWQARQLIRVTVAIIGGEDQEPERVWVSLKSDRYGNKGYRKLVTVLSDEDMRQQLLEDAIEDMQTFREKYNRLKELAGVFEAMGNVTSKKRKAA